MAALFVDPTIGLELVTLRAGAIPARVIREHFLLTVIALMNVASKERRAAGGDIPKSSFLSEAQAASGLLNECRTVWRRTISDTSNILKTRLRDL